jgi:PadR family transcriptional regulator, regulatory protein AphA
MPRHQLPFAFEYLLLGLLYQKPMHGYDLYKELTSLPPVAMIWQIKMSQLYALLDKMEQEGYLASVLIPNETRPAKKQYHLTEQGQASFTQWVKSPVAHPRDIRQNFMARLYFANRMGFDEVKELVKQQRAACRSWESAISLQKKQLLPEQSFEKIVYNYRQTQVNSILAWLDECEKEFIHA